MLVDSSVWVDHLRERNSRLTKLLDSGEVEMHPLVIGEIACGHLRRRSELMALLAALPAMPVAGHDEVLRFMVAHELFGRGMGWIDMHLLASAMLGRTFLWTLDRRLSAAAAQLRLSPD